MLVAVPLTKNFNSGLFLKQECKFVKSVRGANISASTPFKELLLKVPVTVLFPPPKTKTSVLPKFVIPVAPVKNLYDSFVLDIGVLLNKPPTSFKLLLFLNKLSGRAKPVLILAKAPAAAFKLVHSSNKSSGNFVIPLDSEKIKPIFSTDVNLSKKLFKLFSSTDEFVAFCPT